MYYCLCSRYHYAETFTGITPRSLSSSGKNLSLIMLHFSFSFRAEETFTVKSLARLAGSATIESRSRLDSIRSSESALSLFVFCFVNAPLNATPINAPLKDASWIHSTTRCIRGKQKTRITEKVGITSKTQTYAGSLFVFFLTNDRSCLRLTLKSQCGERSFNIHYICVYLSRVKDKSILNGRYGLSTVLTSGSAVKTPFSTYDSTLIQFPFCWNYSRDDNRSAVA